MCGQAVCMQGTARLGAAARSPSPSATRSRWAVFGMTSIPLFQERSGDRPEHVPHAVDELRLPARTKDGQPGVGAQLRFPIQLPVHAGAEEVELLEPAAAGIADGVADQLLAG